MRIFSAIMKNEATTIGSRVNDPQIRCTDVLNTQKRDRPAKIEMS